MYGGKFAFQNRFGKPSPWKEIYRFFCFILYLRAISKYKPPPPWGGAYIWRGDSTEGFLRYDFGGLVHGGAYFRNFTVLHN